MKNDNNLSDMLHLYKKVINGDKDMEFFKEVLDKYSMYPYSGIDAIKEEDKTCKRRKLKF